MGENKLWPLSMQDEAESLIFLRASRIKNNESNMFDNDGKVLRSGGGY